MLRNFVRYFSRNVVLLRRFPPAYGGGRIFVSPDAMLGVLRRDLLNTDPELFQAARLLVRPGDRVWDIGANLGLFSFAAAHLAGPSGEILAVEADAWLATLIRRSAKQRPGGAPVRVLPAAVCEAPGLVEFHLSNIARAGSFVGSAGRGIEGGTRETHLVTGISLDQLLEHAGRPSVIKIDVEGLEAAVLRGGRRLLREARPRLYVEVGEEQRDEVGRILGEEHYHLFKIQEQALAPVDHPVWNTAAIPEEQVPGFTASH